MSELPNIVLVHGAWADGSSWSAVVERLQADGYTVAAPQFPETSLAADGLSNREIGERLFLSHRTIGSHLYRIFPKLEITARSQLRDALPAAVREREPVG